MARRILMGMMLLMVLFSGTAFASDLSICNNDKLYLETNQIYFSDKGIFVLLEQDEGLFSRCLVPQINYDENGLFVLLEHIPLPQAKWCRLGHHACERCGKCSTPGCPTPPCRCN